MTNNTKVTKNSSKDKYIRAINRRGFLQGLTVLTTGLTFNACGGSEGGTRMGKYTFNNVPNTLEEQVAALDNFILQLGKIVPHWNG